MVTIQQLGDDLERLLHGAVDAHFIRERYGNSGSPDISALVSSIEHFLSDSDIRAKDVTYRQMQEEEMTKLIKLLRSGRINEARRISFLHESKAV
jgi:hypothetical protein